MKILLCLSISFIFLLSPAYGSDFYVLENGVGVGEDGDSIFSGFSFGAGSGADYNDEKRRIALTESSSGTYFTGIGLTEIDSDYGIGIWGGSKSSTPYNGTTGALPQVFITQDDEVFVKGLEGSGLARLCVDSDGKLVRGGC